MKKYISLICTLSLILSLFSPSVFAKEQSLPPVSLQEAAEPKSYIFQIPEKADIHQFAELDGASLLCQAAGLYRTENLQLIEELDSRGLILNFEEDGVIYLDGLQEDLAAVKSMDYGRAMVGYSYAAVNNITGAGIKIAVIDSGLWSSFSDYSSATILEGENFLADKDSADRYNVEDNYGHGTFVTSIICGDQTGLAPGVTVLPLKCFDEKNSSYSYVIEAINKAIEEDCHIINMSFGGGGSALLKEAIDLALSKGIIVVAASGNLGSGKVSSGDDILMYPAAYDGVISVGAVENTKAAWTRSCQNDRLWVVAPGASVKGLSIKSKDLVTISGTSFSAPAVSAAAALALSIAPDMTPVEFTELLASTAEDLGQEGKDNSYGYGLLNLALLLETIRGDRDTVSLSRWEGGIGITAYLAEQNAANYLVAYDSAGRLKKLTSVSALCNFTIEEDLCRLSLFSMDQVNYAPLKNKICLE